MAHRRVKRISGIPTYDLSTPFLNRYVIDRYFYCHTGGNMSSYMRTPPSIAGY